MKKVLWFYHSTFFKHLVYGIACGQFCVRAFQCSHLWDTGARTQNVSCGTPNYPTLMLLSESYPLRISVCWAGMDCSNPTHADIIKNRHTFWYVYWHPGWIDPRRIETVHWTVSTRCLSLRSASSYSFSNPTPASTIKNRHTFWYVYFLWWAGMDKFYYFCSFFIDKSTFWTDKKIAVQQ